MSPRYWVQGLAVVARLEASRVPHGGLQPSFEKPTRQEKSDFQAVSAAILVTYHPDFRVDERFCSPRVVGLRCTVQGWAATLRVFAGPRRVFT